MSYCLSDLGPVDIRDIALSYGFGVCIFDYIQSMDKRDNSCKWGWAVSGMRDVSGGLY